MTPETMKEWRKRLNLSLDKASVVLGCSKNTLIAYERRGNIPRYIALACAAIAFGLPPME
jgi:transcriptional regulator with XRE-family HTH domain